MTVTNWKLTKIAEMVGYTDPKYMSRVFKEETGMLPLEYRKRTVRLKNVKKHKFSQKSHPFLNISPL